MLGRVVTFDFVSVKGSDSVSEVLTPGELVKVYATGLCKIRFDDGREVVRHRDRVTPISHATAMALRRLGGEP